MRVVTPSVAWLKNELKNWMVEQPEKTSGCSSMQFLQRKFYHEYTFFEARMLKKVLLIFFRAKNVPFSELQNFLFGVDCFGPGSSLYHYY